MGDASLLQQIGEVNRALPPERVYITLPVTCTDTTQNRDGLLQSLVNAAEDVVPDRMTAKGPTQLVSSQTSAKVSLKFFDFERSRNFETVKRELGFQNLSLSEKLERLIGLLNRSYDCPVLFIIDELDRLESTEGLASDIRSLSGDRLKFMLVGITDNWSTLLRDHQSIERLIAPIHVPRMKKPELAAIIDLAVNALYHQGVDVSFAPKARKRLVDLSGGFPWYIHVLGQSALMATYDSGQSVVSEDQVIMSMRDLTTNRYAQQFTRRYKAAIGGEKYRGMVLRFLASYPESDIPLAVVYDLLQEVGIQDPSRWVQDLMTPAYESILSPAAVDGGGQTYVRFNNELFRHFVFLVTYRSPQDRNGTGFTYL